MFDSLEQYYDPNVSIEEVNENRKEVSEALISELKDILDDPIKSDKLLYLVPGLNIAKFTYEAVQGETTYGAELDMVQRIALLLEGAAITYCLAVAAKSFLGTADGTMELSALAGKTAAFLGHTVVMEKEMVEKMLSYYSENYPDSTLVQALIRATSVIPGYMFSKREINLDEISLEEVNA